jgi:putative ABC transport system permease protein
MGRWRGLASRMGALLRRRRFERDLQDEIRFHLDMETSAGLEQGLGAAEARRSARLRFGGEDGVSEAVREARGLHWLDDVRMDVRYAMRSLRRNRGFALAAVLTLGLGIGATAAVYGVVDGVLLRPLPWPGADRLVLVWQNDRVSGTQREAASLPDYADYVERARSFEGLGAFAGRSANLATAVGDPARVRVASVSASVFPILGVQPLAGRYFTAEEAAPGGPRVAVVSEAMGSGREGGAASLTGTTIRVDDVEYEVVGVAPSTLSFPEAETVVWLPLQTAASQAQRSRHDTMVLARLGPGVSLSAAQLEMDAISADLEATYASNRGRGAFVEPVREALLGEIRPSLLIALGAVALVLLVACANVASLLLARGATRGREIAVRTALGARSGRLARQFAVESLVLTLVGGLLGIAVANRAVGPLLALAPEDLPRAAQVSVDGRVLLVTLVLTIVVGLLFGMVPVHQARAVDLQRTLREEGRGASAGLRRQRFRSAIVVAEVALSVMLVVGAGLLLRSLAALHRVDPGFEPGNLLKVEYTLPVARYPQNFAEFPGWTEVQRFQNETKVRLETLSGVESVALATQHPLDAGFTNSFVIEGRESEYESQPEIRTRMVSADYFETVGVPVVRGRVPDARDAATAPPVLVINEAGARLFFPDSDPIGQRLSFWGNNPRQIVGVVGNERFAGIGEATPPAIYVPLAQAPLASGSILVRTAADPVAMAATIRETIRSVDPDLAVFNITTMSNEVRAAVARERFAATLFTIFAAIALVLAIVGVHGLLSYAVAQRTRELGIRMALGASRRSLLGMVIGEGMMLAGAGLVLGLLGALAASRLLQSLLYEIQPADPFTFVAAGVAVAAAALAASALPARRATASDPSRALRLD